MTSNFRGCCCDRALVLSLHPARVGFAMLVFVLGVAVARAEEQEEAWLFGHLREGPGAFKGPRWSTVTH